MERSESIKHLAAALSKAQIEMGDAELDSKNPYFKTKFASLRSIRNTCKGPLAKYGLSVSQLLGRDGEGDFLETCLMHESGEYLQGRLYMHKSKNMQEVGSCISYARRYSLSSILGIVSEEDDDGENTMNRQTAPSKASVNTLDQRSMAPRKGQITEGQKKAIFAICKSKNMKLFPDLDKWSFERASTFIEEMNKRSQ